MPIVAVQLVQILDEERYLLKINPTPDRLPPLRQFIEEILPEVDGVLALRRGPSRIVSPFLFVKEHPKELVNLAFWPKLFIPDALEIILHAHPYARLVIVCRGCEEGSIVEVFRRANLNMDNVNVITLQCKPSEIEFCGCAVPFISTGYIPGYRGNQWTSQSLNNENIKHTILKNRMN